MRPKITVYIPSHNYGSYLPQAVDSVIHQTFSDWELIIVNEGSSDDSVEIAQRYAAQDPARIRFVDHPEPMGLARTANEVLELARGEYIMRLDADDYLDESALLVMGTYLDQHPDKALVFPNYFYVDHQGGFLHVENRKKIGRESNLLDLPAHGACTLVRKRVLKSVGGYSESIKAQDGYDLWLKIMGRHEVGNVSTPLFYYRQHGESLSRNTEKILENRRLIKRMLAEKAEGAVQPRKVAIVPVKNNYPQLPGIAMRPLAGKPLIDHTLDCAVASKAFSHVFVFADDPEVVKHCNARDGVIAHVRPAELAATATHLEEVIFEAVSTLEDKYDVYPDVLAMLSIHTPLRAPAQIVKAIDTLLLYDADSVISVTETMALNFRHGLNGLEPVNPGVSRGLRLEREALYEDNRAIKVFWRDVVTADGFYGDKVSHIVMPKRSSHIVSDEDALWLAQHILEEHDNR